MLQGAGLFLIVTGLVWIFVQSPRLGVAAAIVFVGARLAGWWQP